MYRGVFEHMAEGLAYCRMIFDGDEPADWVYLAVNPAFEALTGLREVEGRPVSEVIPGIRQADPELFVIYGRVAATGKPERFEQWVVSLKQWFSVLAFCPAPGDFVAVFDVVTERKLAEMALRESERALKASQRIAHVGSWERSSAESATWSEELFRIYGLDPSGPPLPLQGLSRHYPESSWARLMAAVAETQQTGAQTELEAEMIRADGEPRWVLIRIEAVRGMLDEIVGHRGTVLDITEQKRFVTTLAESEARFRLLFEHMSEGFSLNEIVQDADGRVVDFRILEANPAQERHTGWDRATTVGRTIREVLPTVDPQQIEAYGRVALTGEPLTFEYTSAAFGRSFRVNAFSPERGRFATVFEDITDRVQMEEHLRHSQRLESVGRLAGGVAHDFNNMLSVILGYVEEAEAKLAAGASAAHELLEVRKAANHSAELTRQLLTFARRQSVTPRVLELNEVVSASARMLARLIGERITLTWRPAATLWQVRIDPTQVDQILTNLCVNARDAIDGPGQIVIATANVNCDAAFCATRPGFDAGEYVSLSVADTGRGMDEETLRHIFEPFFTTKAVGSGTGLGLSMVYGAVKQNNGYLDVTSEPGQGSTFVIYLPRHHGVAEVAPRERPAVAAPGTGTILVVEDEESLLHLTTTVLTGLGYSVLSTRSPVEAIAIAHAHADQIHLLLTDVIMPDMNGRELAAQVAAIIPGLKCLFVSGYSAEILTPDGELEPGLHFLAKPFNRKSLAAKLREVLG